ncbi:hypothetical protein B0H12DRAFT_1149046 [Mycena haematopus]|nr:hypothetical protein B0H12DRAFT_1149046 [Mycena haematopus]
MANPNPAGNVANKSKTQCGSELPRPVPSLESAPPACAPSTVFFGLRFLLREETHTSTVRARSRSGRGVVGRAAEADYIIVRLRPLRRGTSTAARTQYRTECWLERCLFVDRLCAPEEHPSFRITLSFSGLDVSEACWVKRLLKALGITLAPAFSPRQWGVPVVNMEWLTAMARTGAVPPVHAYLIEPAPSPHTTAPAAEPDAGGRRDKGKGRADDSTIQMQDITNSYGLSSPSKCMSAN